MLLWEDINCLDKKLWISEPFLGSNPKNPLLWPPVTSSRWKQVCSSPVCSFHISFSCNLPASAVGQSSMIFELAQGGLIQMQGYAASSGLAHHAREPMPKLHLAQPINPLPGLADQRSARFGPTALQLAWPANAPPGLVCHLTARAILPFYFSF
jgi:hypothetical protein